MNIRLCVRLAGVVAASGLALTGAPALSRAQTVTKTTTASAAVGAVSNFVSATAFTRLQLTDLSTNITYIYFVTNVTTVSNSPYQIQARLTTAYSSGTMQARLWDGTGTYVNIGTTTSAVVAKGVPRTSQTDEVRFRVALPKGMKSSQLPDPQITYVIAPQ
jgi:hypothetical protein